MKDGFIRDKIFPCVELFGVGLNACWPSFPV